MGCTTSIADDAERAPRRKRQRTKASSKGSRKGSRSRPSSCPRSTVIDDDRLSRIVPDGGSTHIHRAPQSQSTLEPEATESTSLRPQVVQPSPRTATAELSTSVPTSLSRAGSESGDGRRMSASSTVRRSSVFTGRSHASRAAPPSAAGELFGSVAVDQHRAVNGLEIVDPDAVARTQHEQSALAARVMEWMDAVADAADDAALNELLGISDNTDEQNPLAAR